MHSKTNLNRHWIGGLNERKKKRENGEEEKSALIFFKFNIVINNRDINIKKKKKS